MPDLGNPGAGMRTHVIIVAEKGESTTWENSPSQDQYRGDQEWQRYRVSLTQINASQRPNIRLLRPTPNSVGGLWDTPCSRSQLSRCFRCEFA